jgi:hypothetical protein
VPERLALLIGRGGGIISARLDGRTNEETLALELGRDSDDSLGSTPPGFRFGNGPNDKRLTPDVLSRGTCLPDTLELAW